MKGKLLITQGTQPFAQRVGKLLDGQYDVCFGAAGDIPEVLLRNKHYLQLPIHTEAAFEHEVLRTCLDQAVDAVIPLGEKEMDLLGRARQLFAEYGIAIWLPDEAHPSGLALLRNPDRRFPLVVVDHGVAVAGEQCDGLDATLSGVLAELDGERTLALCCITD